MLRWILVLVALGCVSAQSYVKPNHKRPYQLKLTPDHKNGEKVIWPDWTNHTIRCCTYNRYATLILFKIHKDDNCVQILEYETGKDCHFCISHEFIFANKHDEGDYLCFLVSKEDRFSVVVPDKQSTSTPPPTGPLTSSTEIPTTTMTTAVPCDKKPEWDKLLERFITNLKVSDTDLLKTLFGVTSPFDQLTSITAVRLHKTLYDLATWGYKVDDGEVAVCANSTNSRGVRINYALRTIFINWEALLCFLKRMCFGTATSGVALSNILTANNTELIVFAKCDDGKGGLDSDIFLWDGKKCVGDCHKHTDDQCATVVFFNLNPA